MAQRGFCLTVDRALSLAGGRAAPLCQQHWRPSGQDAGAGPPPTCPRLGGEQLQALHCACALKLKAEGGSYYAC
jgi:hypothetical protein